MDWSVKLPSDASQKTRGMKLAEAANKLKLSFPIKKPIQVSTAWLDMLYKFECIIL